MVAFIPKLNKDKESNINREQEFESKKVIEALKNTINMKYYTSELFPHLLKSPKKGGFGSNPKISRVTTLTGDKITVHYSKGIKWDYGDGNMLGKYNKKSKETELLRIEDNLLIAVQDGDNGKTDVITADKHSYNYSNFFTSENS